MFASPKPLRIWPAVVVIALQAGAIIYSITPEFDNFSRFVAMMAGPALSLLLFFVYWFGFSRVPLRQKLVVPAFAITFGILVAFISDPSARPAQWMYGVPLSMLLVSIGLFFTGGRPEIDRLPLMLLLVSLASIPFALVRLDGFTGDYHPEFAWRWSPTAEQQLAKRRTMPTNGATDLESKTVPLSSTREDWPGFRGALRDSRVQGAKINIRWDQKPPKVIWKGEVGPGWSSFCIVGDNLYTQEQFGEEEAVVCYDAGTGKERWRHNDQARFNELVAGPGPRGTPTFADGRIYTFGAMANLNCLDATTGAVLWARSLMKEIDAKLPEWGFASSPLVAEGVVIVYANGKDDHGLVAYKAENGEPAWHLPCGGMNFSSPQPVTLAGQEAIVFTGRSDTFAVQPSTGKVLWRYAASGQVAESMIQPQQIDSSSLVVGLGDGMGTALLKVTQTNDNWSVSQRWTSKSLKPSFNDFVFHQGTLYGFDQNIFAAIDAKTGKRLWKKGRYGFGQVLLFEDQGVMIVLEESGDLVLIACDPNEHHELGRAPALEGKTWNHPAFSRNRLFVRNGVEAVCMDLSP
jgi:outer membrane protein assembly factor BamB